MKVREFFAVTQGSRQFLLADSGDAPMCGRDFWGDYRNTDVWEAEISSVRLIPRRTEQNGLWFDSVVCEIALK